jgi:hypothetical protein
MDAHTQFSTYKCVRFCGLMMSASLALTSRSSENEEVSEKMRQEAQRHLTAGIAAVQQLLPMLEAYAQAIVVQSNAKGPCQGPSGVFAIVPFFWGTGPTPLSSPLRGCLKEVVLKLPFLIAYATTPVLSTANNNDMPAFGRAFRYSMVTWRPPSSRCVA